MLRTTSGVVSISLLRCRRAEADATRVSVLSVAAMSGALGPAACWRSAYTRT